MQYRPNRQQTQHDVTLNAEGEAIGATVLDISRDGAKLAVPYPLLVGTAVQLKLGKATAKAVVHWCENNNIGIRFLDRLDRDTFLMIESTDAPQSTGTGNYIFGK